MYKHDKIAKKVIWLIWPFPLTKTILSHFSQLTMIIT